jgi:hypothetical protein
MGTLVRIPILNNFGSGYKLNFEQIKSITNVDLKTFSFLKPNLDDQQSILDGEFFEP